MSKRILKYISKYEEDITSMAYKYAIGRQLPSTNNICFEILKNIYNRMSNNDMRRHAIDIRKEIGKRLLVMPFSFSMNVNIQTNSEEYDPFARFVEWIKSNNIEYDEDLNLWNSIQYNANGIYEEYRENTPRTYVTNDWKAMQNWAILANILDYKRHRFCIYSNPNGNELIEYVEAYILTDDSDKIACDLKKIPIHEYVNNYLGKPIVESLAEEHIIKSDMKYTEAMEECKNL